MARIVIDGYNLLPATDFKDRDRLIAALAKYQTTKKHDITVVFDGTYGGLGSGDRDYSSGVEVIFTPLTITADDVIERMLPKLDPNTTIVVSSDRRIQIAARRAGAVFVSSQEFARRLTRKSSDRFEGGIPPWMEGRTEEESSKTKGKRGIPKKASKEERRRKRSLHKL